MALISYDFADFDFVSQKKYLLPILFKITRINNYLTNKQVKNVYYNLTISRTTLYITILINFFLNINGTGIGRQQTVQYTNIGVRCQ